MTILLPLSVQQKQCANYLLKFAKMAINIKRYFPLTIFLILMQTSSASLNCENLDVVACKHFFGEQLDNQIRELHIETYRKALDYAYNFYAKLLNDLSDNHLYAEPIRKHLSIINTALPKLNRNTDCQTLLGIIKEMRGTYDPDFYNVNIDEESKKDYDDLLFKHNFENFHAARIQMRDELNEKMIELWRALFEKLRPNDITAYNEYEKFDAEIKVSKLNDVGRIWQDIAIFFDTPYLKEFYSI